MRLSRIGSFAGTLLVASLAPAACPAQERPPLVWREDWKELPAATPVTQEHVANPDLVLALHGPGRDGIKKSHHDTPKDDPYYIWSGTCSGPWAVTLRHRSSSVDLTGLARVRWRARQDGFRQLRLVLGLPGGAWLVSDAADGHSRDWRVVELNVSDLRWRRLDIEKVVEGAWVEKPDLSRIEAIGFTDLMGGGGTPASSRLDWLEVWGKPVPRASTDR